MSTPTPPPTSVKPINKWETFLERVKQFKEIWAAIVLIGGALTAWWVWWQPPMTYQLTALQFTWSYPNSPQQQYFVCATPVFERAKPGAIIIKNVAVWVALTERKNHFASIADGLTAVRAMDTKRKRLFELFGWTETRENQDLEVACKLQTNRSRTATPNIPVPIKVEPNDALEKVLRFRSMSDKPFSPFKRGYTSLIQVCVYLNDELVPNDLSQRPQINSDSCRYGEWYSVLSPTDISELSADVPSVRIRSIKRL